MDGTRGPRTEVEHGPTIDFAETVRRSLAARSEPRDDVYTPGTRK